MDTLELLLGGLLEDPGDEGRYLVLADCSPPTRCQSDLSGRPGSGNLRRGHLHHATVKDRGRSPGQDGAADFAAPPVTPTSSRPGRASAHRIPVGGPVDNDAGGGWG
jgi:hypothetical protein